jgi:hypothetical protein
LDYDCGIAAQSDSFTLALLLLRKERRSFARISLAICETSHLPKTAIYIQRIRFYGR